MDTAGPITWKWIMKEAIFSVRHSAILLALLLLVTSSGFAHCDGLDGPVVQAAQKALSAGHVNLVLIWVPERDEPEIRRVFERTLAVRKLAPEARDVADRYFFETVVRLHRTAEGAPYTGLQPAGRDFGPAIPAADKALETGTIQEVDKLLTEALRAGLQRQFQNVQAKKNFRVDDVAVGREYVKAYVEFVHYVERIYEAATLPAHGHFPEVEKSAGRPEAHTSSTAGATRH
jgi:hypothetical protein